MKPAAVIGCDPGARGCICLLVPDAGLIEFVANTATPSLILEWLKQRQLEYTIRMAVIEDVHSIFGMSAKSNFGFGFNTGLVTGILQVSGLGLDKVAPKKWQKFIGVKKKGKEIKKEVGTIASRLYPNAKLYGLKGGLDDGKSDSLMIAHYAYLTYK